LRRLLIFAIDILFIIFWVLISILGKISNRRVWFLVTIFFLSNIIDRLIVIFWLRNKSWRVVFVVIIRLNLILLFKVFIEFFNLRIFVIFFIKFQDILTFRTLLILIWMLIYIFEVKVIRILMGGILFLHEFSHLSRSVLLKSLFFLFRIVATKGVLTVENRLVLIWMIKLSISERLSISIKVLLCVLRVLVIVSIRIFSGYHPWLFRYVNHFLVFVLFYLTLFILNKILPCHQ